MFETEALSSELVTSFQCSCLTVVCCYILNQLWLTPMELVLWFLNPDCNSSSGKEYGIVMLRLDLCVMWYPNSAKTCVTWIHKSTENKDVVDLCVI